MKKRIERVLENYCMDEDLTNALRLAGLETSFDIDDIDYDDGCDTSLTYTERFEVKDSNENIYRISISGTASKEMSYDRWVSTDCVVINDYSVELVSEEN